MMKKEKRFFIIFGVVLVFAVALWLFIEKPYQEKKTVAVNLQVTEYKDPAALSLVVNELDARRIKSATIFVGKEIAEKNCSLIKELDQKGYEIAAFGYALDDKGNFIQLATLPKGEQEKIINDTKAAIENCLNHSINGFRAQRFSKNNDTNEIVKNLGFKWDGSFVTNWDAEASAFPYYSENYGFYVVSIEGVGKSGYVLCDAAMASYNKTSQEWRETIQSYFLQHQQEETPFITEFHPYFLVANPDWWNEFISLLDWFKMQNSTYLTTQQFIDHSCNLFFNNTGQQLVNQSYPVCGE